MSRTYPYRTLDVFTSTPYAGNQLGVITIPADQPLSQSEKQLIATEFNYSESIFVHSPSPSTTTTSSPPEVTVDIFTPQSELPFAGHPTIGAIHHVLTHVYPSLDSVIITLKAGPVIGRLDRNTGFASAQIPHEFHRHAKVVDWAAVGASQPALGRVPAVDAQHALISIVRGLNFALVDLTPAPELLKEVKVAINDVVTGSELDEGWPQTLVGTLYYVRKPDGKDGVIRIEQRVMVIGLEDPATGSASCALTAYLALERGGEGAVYRFELVQGVQMGRRSVIGVEVTLDETGKGIAKVVLSGQCKGVMKGELEI